MLNVDLRLQRLPSGLQLTLFNLSPFAPSMKEPPMSSPEATFPRVFNGPPRGPQKPGAAGRLLKTGGKVAPPDGRVPESLGLYPAFYSCSRAQILSSDAGFPILSDGLLRPTKTQNGLACRRLLRESLPGHMPLDRPRRPIGLTPGQHEIHRARPFVRGRHFRLLLAVVPHLSVVVRPNRNVLLDRAEHRVGERLLQVQVPRPAYARAASPVGRFFRARRDATIFRELLRTGKSLDGSDLVQHQIRRQLPDAGRAQQNRRAVDGLQRRSDRLRLTLDLLLPFA